MSQFVPSTDRRKLADTYRRALAIMLHPDYHALNGCCGAIGRAECRVPYRDIGYPCDFDSKSEAQKMFRAFFCHTRHGWWWDASDTDSRAIALALAAAIAERP